MVAGSGWVRRPGRKIGPPWYLRTTLEGRWLYSDPVNTAGTVDVGVLAVAARPRRQWRRRSRVTRVIFQAFPGLLPVRPSGRIVLQIGPFFSGKGGSRGEPPFSFWGRETFLKSEAEAPQRTEARPGPQQPPVRYGGEERTQRFRSGCGPGRARSLAHARGSGREICHAYFGTWRRACFRGAGSADSPDQRNTHSEINHGQRYDAQAESHETGP